MSAGPGSPAERRRLLRLAERGLNLAPGDLRRSSLLFLFLFLIISTYVIGKVARDALFLARFQARELPYADLTIALAVGFVVAAYVRISRHTSVRNLLAGSMLFFSLNCVFFWTITHFYHLPWSYPLFYVWVGIFGVLAPAQVWTLANYVLTTREARRVFGVVGSGAILGWIFAGFITKPVVQRFGTESLLVAMTLALATCSALVVVIWAQGRGHAAGIEEQANGDEPHTLRQSVALIASSPYLKSIAAVIFFSSLATTVIGWQFKATAKLFITGKDSLAIFFGDFNLYCGLLAMVVQLALTGRVIRRFGIGPALFTVPIALLAGSGGLALTATLIAAVVLKGADQVLRYSIDKSTVELLYLPLASRVKIQVKWFIDTVVWRGGDGVAGLLLLLLVTRWGMAPQRLSWVAMGLIAGWLSAAYVARRYYVDTLKKSIQQHRIEVERATAPLLDRAAAQVLLQKLHEPDANEVLYALRLLEMERSKAPHPAVRSLLAHPAPEVKRKALEMLADANDNTLLPQVEQLLQDPDRDVRTEAMLFLCHHSHVDPLQRIEELGEVADVSIQAGAAAFLARPGETQNLLAAREILRRMAADADAPTRAEAARLLGILPDEFDPLAASLLADAEKSVRREAIRSAARLRKRRLAPAIVDALADPDLGAAAGEALVAFGDTIVGVLRDSLCDRDTPLQIRRRIPDVLAAIHSDEAVRVLESHLMESDTVTRFAVIHALNKLRRNHPELELDQQMVETVLAAEILGHYRSYQILHTLEEHGGEDATMRRTLEENIQREQERIFRLLTLLYPQHDFHSTFYGLQSGSPAVHDNALEFLDNVLKPQLRYCLVPLLDAQVSVAQRARLATRWVFTAMATPEEAVAALLNSDDPWLRSCGAYATGTLAIRALEPQLDRCLSDPDPLLRQAAIDAKHRLKRAAAVS